MQLTTVHENPFALLIAPEAVFAALEQSDCLHTLVSRVCKPLDERETKKPRQEQAPATPLTLKAA
jgi:hypothetical protein